MFLVFQLKAPLASFGSNLGELRLSDAVPRKSAVTGLLAAACGIRREETQRFQTLARSFRMAVAVLREPKKTTDFHTVQSPVTREAPTRAAQVAEIEDRQRSSTKYSGTIVTRREYLQDGHWVIVLDGEEAHLRALSEALNAPLFTLYVGRKSCALSAFTAPMLFDTQYAEDAVMQWATQVGVRLPEQTEFHWDRNVSCKTEALSRIRKSDVRTRLTYNHFSTRDVFEGTAAF